MSVVQSPSSVVGRRTDQPVLDATGEVGTGALKLLVILAFAFPLILMCSAALRPNAEMLRYSNELSIFSVLPAEPTTDAFTRLLGRPLFLWQLLNTVVTGAVLATLSTIVSLAAAYPLARWNLPGKSAVFAIMLATLFVPLDVVLTPLFFVVRDLRMLNTFWGLVLPFVFSPLGVYLLRQAIQEVPKELDQAAMLDGAGPIEVLRTAILPNIRPALLAVWLMEFVFVWEWFLWPVIGMRRDEGQLAQVAIAGLLDPLGGNDYALVFAGSVVVVLPAFAVFVLLQRFLVDTIVLSSGK